MGAYAKVHVGIGLSAADQELSKMAVTFPVLRGVEELRLQQLVVLRGHIQRAALDAIDPLLALLPEERGGDNWEHTRVALVNVRVTDEDITRTYNATRATLIDVSFRELARAADKLHTVSQVALAPICDALFAAVTGTVELVLGSPPEDKEKTDDA